MIQVILIKQFDLGESVLSGDACRPISFPLIRLFFLFQSIIIQSIDIFWSSIVSLFQSINTKICQNNEDHDNQNRIKSIRLRRNLTGDRQRQHHIRPGIIRKGGYSKSPKVRIAHIWEFNLADDNFGFCGGAI